MSAHAAQLPASGRGMPARLVWNHGYLLFIAGLGGLLYGIDVGIIAGALPYLQETSPYTAGQLSFIVAAVLLGSVLSSLFAGALADWAGRKKLMLAAGLLFVTSVPTICLSQGYQVLLAGRLLQGLSGGLIGVVVPLYLAESLSPETRGRGTAVFQWLLTAGLVAAALIGLAFAHRVDQVQAAVRHVADEALRNAQVLAAKDFAWRAIFWASLIPGALFTLGACFIPESPRWLFRCGRSRAARLALERTRTAERAGLEMAEMEQAERGGAQAEGPSGARGTLFQRRYIVPFLLACLILACTQATGVNSILAYVVNILNQAGLPGSVANQGDVIIKGLNFVMTLSAVVLVDRKGRKFLLSVGSGGIVICLALAGVLFFSAEQARVDLRPAFQQLEARSQRPEVRFQVGRNYLLGTRGLRQDDAKAYAWLASWYASHPGRPGQEDPEGRIQAGFAALQARFAGWKQVADPTQRQRLHEAWQRGERLSRELDRSCVILFDREALETLAGPGPVAAFPRDAEGAPLAQLVLSFGYGPQTHVASKSLGQAVEIYPSEIVPGDDALGAFFRRLHLNPFRDPAQAKGQPLCIHKALISPIPGSAHGWLVALCLFGFISCYAFGPGVCVWLALSELMPTRIRSNGMSIALLVNQFVSTLIAAVFLPMVGAHGYSAMFFFWAGCTVIYFITATFFLPETKGKTLEEIEAHFAGELKGR